MRPFFYVTTVMRIVCTNCPHDVRKSYTGKEPSPNGLGLSASYEILGVVARGKDRKLWQVVSNGNKKRWPPTSDVKNYLIHDNGSRPFLVRMSDVGVFVYKVTEPEDDDYDNDKVYKQVAKRPHEIFVYRWIGDTCRTLLTKPFFIKPLQVFVPQGFAGDEADKAFEGNTILLRTGDKEYVFIGHYIGRFKTSDHTVEYHSQSAVSASATGSTEDKDSQT